MNLILTIVVLALVIPCLVDRFVHHLRLRTFIRSHRCEPIHRMPQRERILGLDVLKEQIAAIKAHRNLEVVTRRYAEHGSTFSLSMLGQTYINTIDPENIRAVLATRFDDFSVGNRELAWGPMLGKGVFTSDGEKWKHSRVRVKHPR